MAKGHDRRRMELQFWSEEYALAPDVEAPADWPIAYRLGSPGLYPATCGDHAPGFIGLYAVINGLALVLSQNAPLRPAEERLLIDQGWKFLTSRGLVAPWHGTQSGLIERLAEALTFTLSRRRNQFIRCERVDLAGNVRSEQLGIVLERLVVAKRVVVILLGGGHYTVIRGFTPFSWLIGWPKGAARRGRPPRRGHVLRTKTRKCHELEGSICALLGRCGASDVCPKTDVRRRAFFCWP
jgi:hypothetical protein